MKVTTLLSLYSIYIHIYICISVCLSMCAHNIFVITFSKPSRKHFSAVSSLFWTLWAHGLTTGWAGLGWDGMVCAYACVPTPRVHLSSLHKPHLSQILAAGKCPC